MVRQTKRFKKGLNKKVLSAILAASMIMTSSSFAMAATNPEPLNEDAQTTEAPVADELEGLDDVTEDTDGDLTTDDAAGNSVAAYAAAPTAEDANAVDALAVNKEYGDFIEKTGLKVEGIQTGATFEYTGEEVRPEIKIVDTNNKDKELVYGQDYHLTYSNNTDVYAIAGPAKLVIEFDGPTYGGKIPNVTYEYKITERQVSSKTATVIYATEENLKYNGKKQYPEIESVTVQIGEKYVELSPDDYEIVEAEKGRTYTNVSDHPYIVKVVGKGNYTGTLDTKEYDITPAELGNGDTVVSIDPIAFKTNQSPKDIQKLIQDSIVVYDKVNDRNLDNEEYTIKYMNEKTGEYTLDEPENANKGIHQVRIYGAKNYDPNSYVDTNYEIGEESLQMAINKALKDGDITVKGFTHDKNGFYTTYNGLDQFIDNDEVKIKKSVLSADQYDVVTERADWTNAGIYYITFEGENNFEGDIATIPVYVNPRAINEGEYKGADYISYVVEQGKHRSGELGSVEVKVTDRGTDNSNDGIDNKTLKEGVDYTYEGVVKEKDGKMFAVIRGIGNYTTEVSGATVYKKSYTPNDKLYLNDESITAEVVKDYPYTGKPVKPTASDIKLVEKDLNNEYEITDADFYVSGYKNNTNAGEATVIITAKGESNYYTGSREITFKIGGLDFAETFEFAPIGDVAIGTDWADVLKQIKVEYQSNGAVYASYNNPQNRCDFEILKDGKRVTATDLKDEITESGTYTVVAKPIESRYAGSLETTFTVKGVDIAQNTTVSAIEDQVYTGEAIEPKVTVKNDNMTLVEGKDYTLSYSGNVEGGTAVVIVNGIGNYSGTVEKEFTITQGQQEITMTNPLQERDLANGSRTTTSKACTLKLGYALEDKNMSLSYATSDPSVATVNNGKITYEGVGECTITVTAKETNNCKADTLEIKVKVGKPGTPTFTPTVSSKTAKKSFVVTSSTVKGADGFEVQYSIRPDWWKATTKDFSNIGAGGKLYRQTLTTYHSNKTYYIHVRAYQIVNGEKVYSEWSPMKTAKTK